MPEGQEDDRLQHRYRQLLEPPSTTVNVMGASHDKGNDSPEPDVPFVDPDLQALWTTAIEQDKSFKRIRRAVIERAQKFPRELEL